MELIYPELPANPLYRIVQDNVKGTTTLVFNNGYCNGYVHKTKAWKTLMESPVIAVPSKKTVLAVEITSRIGPAAVFKVYRCRHPEKIARSIDLSPKEAYVKVLDIRAAVNRQTGKIKYPLKYVSMREDEYMDVFNYALSLDPKLLTFPNIVSYIRRRMGGLSLITKELVEPWYLPKREVETVAITILIDVKIHHVERERIESQINVGSVLEKFRVLLKKCARVVFYPIALLIDWIMSGHLTDQLVLFPDGTCFQKAVVQPSENMSVDSGLYADHSFEGEIPACPVCFECMGKLGEQELECHTKESTHEFSISTDVIKDLHTKLIDNDNDAAGLKAVKERAAKNLPTTGFKHTVVMRVLEAGPGCGKSYIIRQMATEHDLVLAPFTKLRSDYTGLVSSNGESYDLNFKTTHRAMESRGCRRIFVDEYTAFPYEFLACVAFLNAATEVILVGDRKQTGIREPEEGLNMLNHIDIPNICTHTLRKNFRNPADTVAMLNRVYDYKMEPVKAFTEKSITFVEIAELPRLTTSTAFAFTKASAKAQTENENSTVRSFQGSTCKRSVLFCTSLDGNLPSVEELQIVALSRHTEHLYIVHENCEQAKILMEKLKLDADFYAHLEIWITFPREDTRRVVQEDCVVPFVCKPQQPVRDAYLLLETFMPTIANDPDCTSLNAVGSNLVGEHFNSGRTVPEYLIMPRNKRNHPCALTETYYSAGSGVGNHFSSKQPLQTLQVLQARYLNKQPFFPFGYTQKSFAEQLVDMWFKECVDLSKLTDVFNSQEVQEVINQFVVHITQRNYQASFAGSGRIDNDQGRVIRFALKGIFKPKHGEPDVTKAGQGISAWSTDACAMFCSVFRVLNNAVIRTEKQNVITDGYISESQFIERTNQEFAKVSLLCDNATTDGVTFDANQNVFTQEIEKCYWRKMGVSEEFLDHYYSFRKNYVVISTAAIGFAGTQKTSGEPGTLVNNGAVSKVLSDAIVRGEGPFVINYKGDDFNKRQLNLKVDEEMQAKVNAACALQLRVHIGKTAEFCGLLFAHGTLFPSIPRKLNKIHAHRFKDYNHFCQYQTALRDWVQRIANMDEMQVVGHNSDHYLSDYREMNLALDVIKSVAHIDEEQFKSLFIKRTEPSIVPVRTSTGKFALVE